MTTTVHTTLLNHLHARDKILAFAEPVGRYAFVLLITQRDAFAQRAIDARGHAVVAHSEQKFLRHRAGHGHHCQLAFPRFKEPAFV